MAGDVLGFDGKRAQADGVEELEDRGVRADTERERQDSDGREPWASTEQAGGVVEVLPEVCEEILIGLLTNARTVSPKIRRDMGGLARNWAE